MGELASGCKIGPLGLEDWAWYRVENNVLRIAFSTDRSIFRVREFSEPVSDNNDIDRAFAVCRERFRAWSVGE